MHAGAAPTRVKVLTAVFMVFGAFAILISTFGIAIEILAMSHADILLRMSAIVQLILGSIMLVGGWRFYLRRSWARIALEACSWILLAALTVVAVLAAIEWHRHVGGIDWLYLVFLSLGVGVLAAGIVALIAALRSATVKQYCRARDISHQESP